MGFVVNANRKALLMATFTTVFVIWGPLTLAKLWAARHSQSDSYDGVVARTILVGG